MDKLQAMEVFVQVVDTGSFTRAAQTMKLPKATVSTLIRNLEGALAAKLLNRTTRRISVTPDGAAYYERCLNILAEVRDAEDALLTAQSSPRGRLRVDVAAGLGRHIVLHALPAFLAHYPGIKIEIGCSDRPVDLIEEGIDCAIRTGELPDSTLIARRIGSLHYLTCAASSYVAMHGLPMHPNDLLAHECINFVSAKSGKTMEWDFERAGEHVRLKVPGRVAVNDSDAYLAACVAGMGIAQIPMYSLCQYLKSGQVLSLLEDWNLDPVPVHVVYPQNRHLSAKVRVFVEWISELFADHEALRPPSFYCGQQGKVPIAQDARLKAKQPAALAFSSEP